MAWIEGYEPPKDGVKDWNQIFKQTLKGELDEETARKTLGKFLIHNPGLFATIMTGMILVPYQRLVIKGWFRRNFSLHVAGRGLGKTLVLAHFAYMYCLTHPDEKVMLVSGGNFRSSRGTLQMIYDWANKRDSDGREPGAQLRQCFAGEMEKKQDMWRIKFKNGSSITAIPLGAGDNCNNLRGFRANVLLIDEALMISPKVINLVLKPFLMGGANATEKLKIREREDRLIAAGKMEEGDRQIFKSTSKMIQISSASYQWEPLYETYKSYLKTIYLQEDRRMDKLIAAGKATNEDRSIVKCLTKKDFEQKEEFEPEPDATYLVQQYSYKIGNRALMDPAMLEELDSGKVPENILNREYLARFTLESGGYFNARKMEDCTVPEGERPCAEIVGDKKADYILAIDPNVSNEAHGDHFAMCLLKLVDKVDLEGKVIKRIPMMVNGYGVCGVDVRQHIDYFLYLIKHFNIVYIIEDATQGKMGDFLSTVNEVEKLELKDIGADFSGNFDEQVKQVKAGYNPSTKQIVHKQAFAGPFIRAANEHMKGCFDFTNMRFASKIMSVDGAPARMAAQDIGDVYRTHPEFCDKTPDGHTEGTMYNFLQYQDNMIDLTKKECSLVQPTITSMGNMTFDLPMRRNKDPKRPRKDNYSALMLGLWATKIYLAAQELPPPEEDDWVPVTVQIG